MVRDISSSAFRVCLFFPSFFRTRIWVDPTNGTQLNLTVVLSYDCNNLCNWWSALFSSELLYSTHFLLVVFHLHGLSLPSDHMKRSTFRNQLTCRGEVKERTTESWIVCWTHNTQMVDFFWIEQASIKSHIKNVVNIHRSTPINVCVVHALVGVFIFGNWFVEHQHRRMVKVKSTASYHRSVIIQCTSHTHS